MFIQFIVNAHNVRKTTKMVNFDHIFDVFSVQYNWIVLIYFSSCQTSPGTSLEYPHHTHYKYFWKLTILGHFLAFLGHFWGCTGHFKPIYPLLINFVSPCTGLEYPKRVLWSNFEITNNGHRVQYWGPFYGTNISFDPKCGSYRWFLYRKWVQKHQKEKKKVW